LNDILNKFGLKQLLSTIKTLGRGNFFKIF
jgi:hypothetical protein